MAQNTSPIFTLTGNVSGLNFTAANTNSQGTGTIATDIYKIFTANATNGSYVSRIRLNPTATAAATATTATTLRVFISTKTSGATTGGTDTWLFAEVSAAAQTADHSTTATFFIEVPLGFVLPASYTILVTTHVVAAANTAWQAVVYGGDY